MILSVFTEKYKTIQRKLINSAVASSNNNEMPVKAQWDTGATGTCISKELVRKMKLLPTGKQKIHTPSGEGIVNKYMIDLVLNQELVIQNIPVIDSEIGVQGIDVLIGMDIISLGDFAISNFEGKTQFSFRIPSQKDVDYKKDATN